MGNSCPQFQISDLDSGNFNIFQSPDFFIFDIVGRAVCKKVRHSAQSGFHYPAGRTEDHAGSGSIAKGTVKVTVSQLRKFNTDIIDHFAQFPGSQYDIYVRHAFGFQFRAGRLVFFCRAGHYRYHNNISRVYVIFLCVVSFQNSAEHLVRGFAGGKIIQHVRIIMFTEFDPAWRAGSNQRKFSVASDPVDQFCAFFHNSQVRAGICVKNFVKAEHFQSCNHFSRDQSTYGHFKGFSKSCSYSWSCLSDHVLAGIINGLPDSVDV